MDVGHTGVDPFREVQPRLAELEAHTLEVGGLLVNRVRVLAADRARSDRGPPGVVSSPLDLFAFPLSATVEYAK